MPGKAAWLFESSPHHAAQPGDHAAGSHHGKAGGPLRANMVSQDMTPASAAGKYYRPDLNFPRQLPRRSSGLSDFERDPPLSSCGTFQARLAGKQGQRAGDSDDHSFTGSPCHVSFATIVSTASTLPAWDLGTESSPKVTRAGNGSAEVGME